MLMINLSVEDTYINMAKYQKIIQKSLIMKKQFFYDFAKRIGYTDDFKGSKTFWKKRVYLDLFPLGKGIVYKDSLKAVEIHHIYEVVDNPIIEYLEKDLGFKGYSELVFDREQELKNMMLKK